MRENPVVQTQILFPNASWVVGSPFLHERVHGTDTKVRFTKVPRVHREPYFLHRHPYLLDAHFRILVTVEQDPQSVEHFDQAVHSAHTPPGGQQSAFCTTSLGGGFSATHRILPSAFRTGWKPVTHDFRGYRHGSKAQGTDLEAGPLKEQG